MKFGQTDHAATTPQERQMTSRVARIDALRGVAILLARQLPPMARAQV